MAFFNVKGSSKWNDDTDDKQLHSNLFHTSTPSSPKKLKKGKKQALVGQLQFKEEHSKNHKKLDKKRQISQERAADDFKTIKKHKKDNSQSGKLVLHSPVRDANFGSKTKIQINPDLFHVANDQDNQTQKISKKKRKRKNSQGDSSSDTTSVKKSPSKDQKFAKKFDKRGRVDEAHDKSHAIEPPRHVTQVTQNSAKQTKHKQHLEVHKEEGQEEEKPKKKRRKRKAKKNKFKDEDGNLKEQYRKQLDTLEDQKLASSTSVLTQRNNSIVPKSTNGDISRHRKKVSSQMQSKLSLQQSSDTDVREKAPTAVPATDAAKKRKRTRKRKRQNSESTSEEVLSKNAKPVNGKLLNALESTANEKSLKPVQGSGGLLKSVTEMKNNKNKGTKNNKNKGTGLKQKAAGIKQSQDEEVTIVKPGAKRKHDMDTSGLSRKDKEMFPVTNSPNKKSTSSDKNLGEAANEVKSKDRSKESKGPSLRLRLENQLGASHFRFINEKLYKCSGEEAYEMMTQDNDAFEVYHEGYSQQVQQWPVNPVDVIIKHLNSRPASLIVGDFGCGEARIAQTVNQKVHSFDLAALNDYVTVCDIAKVPLADGTLDVAVFCLSLMGTNWIDYVKEANRVLKTGGILKIAEVASRFQSLTGFLKIMKSLGFQSTSKDLTNKMFYLFDFSKQKPFRDIDVSKGEILKPCLYKKR